MTSDSFLALRENTIFLGSKTAFYLKDKHFFATTILKQHYKSKIDFQLKLFMNGKGLLNDNVTIMTGVPFPGTKADFVKKLFLGKYDGTSGSNLEAFQVCNIEK